MGGGRQERERKGAKVVITNYRNRLLKTLGGQPSVGWVLVLHEKSGLYLHRLFQEKTCSLTIAN